MIAAVCLPHRH